MPPRFALHVNPTLQLTAIADVSRRGRGRARVSVTDPDAVRLLLAAVTTGRPVRVPAAVRRQLRDDGVLVRDRDVPRDVNLEARLIATANGPIGTAVVVRPGCQLLNGPDLPETVAARTANDEPFLPEAPILWVPDPTTGFTLPYVLSKPQARTVVAWLAGTRVRMPSGLAAALAGIGALATPRDARRQRERWRQRVNDWRSDLARQGFAVLRGLLPAPFVAALRRYYRDIEREGYLYGGDARKEGLPLVHGEPVLSFLTGQFTALVRRIVGSAVRPTFSPYLRIYDPGAILERHRDRPVCRWNVDLVVGGDPAPTRQVAWPLYIAARGRVRPVRLGLGDAVLYQGAAVEHWRRPQPRRRTTAVASLHYGAPPAPA